MKTMTKKNIMKACAILAVAAIPVAFASFKTVDANADTTTPTASEFYMTEGAAVRTTSDEVGIRFNATITKAYWEDLQKAYGADATYSFYSVVTDGTTPIKKDYGTLTPDFTSANDYTFYSTIVYTTDELESAGLLDEACELELSAQTYVDVTKVGESEPTTIAAYGKTGKRSMKAVANAAALAGNADEDLAKYFTVGNRSEAIECYSFSDKSGAVNMKAMPAWTNDMEVYYGAEKLNASLDAKGNVSFTGFELPEGKTEGYMSVFNGSTVYSAKVSTALKITQDNAPTLMNGITGTEVIYLWEDVDIYGKGDSTSGYRWKSTVSFTGVFDGGNHTISGLLTDLGGTNYTYYGLFKQFGGTIKNVAFTNVTLRSNSAVIAGESIGTPIIENVFIDVTKTNDNNKRYGAIFYRTESSSTTTITLNNVVIRMPGNQTQESIFGWRLKYPVSMTNVYTVGIKTTAPYPWTDSASSVSATEKDCGYFADLTTFNGATKTLTPFLTSCVAKYFNNAH